MHKPKSVENYLSKISKENKTILEKLRRKIKATVPNATESISYGMPAFKYKGKPLIYYAAFKDHLSLFPTSSPMGKLDKELEPYKTGKGTLQYPAGTEFPDALLKKLLTTRIEDIETNLSKSGY